MHVKRKQVIRTVTKRPWSSSGDRGRQRTNPVDCSRGKVQGDEKPGFALRKQRILPGGNMGKNILGGLCQWQLWTLQVTRVRKAGPHSKTLPVHTWWASVALSVGGLNEIYAKVWTSLVAELVKNLPAMRETWVRSLGWEDPLEKGKATHFSILAWRIQVAGTAYGGDMSHHISQDGLTLAE